MTEPLFPNPPASWRPIPDDIGDLPEVVVTVPNPPWLPEIYATDGVVIWQVLGQLLPGPDDTEDAAGQ